MKRVIKIILILSVLSLAVFLASSCCNQQCAANAAGDYELYIINNPLDESLYQYSDNGVDFYHITGTLSDFISTYYNGITHTEPLQLFIGIQGTPLVTSQTITISKDTEAEIYLENIVASTIPLQEFNRDVSIAMKSAIILSADANLTVNKAHVTTDGARAITQNSTGTLTVNGDGQETVIHSINKALPTYGGTVFIDYCSSAQPAYVQNGGSILNSSDSSYTSVILNYSDRDVFINGGNVVSTPSINPFGDYGMGETIAIHNVSDGVINISQPLGASTVVASANALTYYNGVINLSGVATGKTTLHISGGNIINYNDRLTLAQRCYTIYTVNQNNVLISDANIVNNCGYVINNSGRGDISIQNSTINNAGMAHNTPSIYMPEGNLEIIDSEIYSTAYYMAAIKADTGNVSISGSVIEGAGSAYGCLYMGSGNLSVSTSEFLCSSYLKIYLEAAENEVAFDNFSISGNLNVNVIIQSELTSVQTQLNNFVIEAVNNSYSDEYFRAWYNYGAHYSDNVEIIASSLPIGAMLSIHVENVYQFIPDAAMQNGVLFAHTPIKTFEGLSVSLVFRPDTAYYLYEVYYYDNLFNKVQVFLHSGDNYTETPFIETTMTDSDRTIYADFRPVPISLFLNNVTATYGTNSIRLYANINSYNGVVYYYTWYRDGAEIAGQNSNSLQLYNVDESGSYSVQVTNNLDGINTAEASALATINPKSVPAVWSETTVFQYSGTDQYPTATARDLQNNLLIVIYDGINYIVGRHTLTATTTNPNYVLYNNIIGYDIIPLTTTLIWSNLSFVYNGSQFRPTAYAEDVVGNPLSIMVSGAETDASVTPYTAYATTTDGSYVFDNAYQEYTIAPAERTVNWNFQYTDPEYSVYFYNGYDQRMRIEAYYYNIYDYKIDLEVSVTGTVNGESVFKKPDIYSAIADFVVFTPNYTLRSEATQIRMFKARPSITVPENEFTFVYDGFSHYIIADIVYADTIIFVMDGSEINNSFIEPGVYTITLTSAEDALHDKAPEVIVSVTVLSTTVLLTDEEGNTISSLYNANGVDPNAELMCAFNTTITPEMNKRYVDYWGRSVLSIINLSLSEDNGAAIDGVSKVRIKLDNETVSNRVLKLRCIRDDKVVNLAYTLDEEGYIEFEVDALGEYALVGTSGVNSIIGVSAFVIISIVIVSSLIIFLVRRKKAVY